MNLMQRQPLLAQYTTDRVWEKLDRTFSEERKGLPLVEGAQYRVVSRHCYSSRNLALTLRRTSANPSSR